MMTVDGPQWKGKRDNELLVPCGLLGEAGRLSVFHRVGSECLLSFQVTDHRLQIVFAESI